MSNSRTQFLSVRKTMLALTMSLAAAATAQADVFTGTINATIDPTHGKGTTIDYWAFSLSADANVIIDVRANEGYVNSWGSHPGAYVDLNGDGEITLSDTQFRLYQDSVSLDTEIVAADDGAGYTSPGNSNGWADGTLSRNDSYLSTALQAGNYIIAFGDYDLDTNDAIRGFNSGDNIAAYTGINPFTGVTGQDHFDYQITLQAFDFNNGGSLSAQAIQVDATGTPINPVPVPGAVWLFGTALAGFLGSVKRKRA
ncbi:MAG: PEP-CTERM sorting domain-containing protein [Methylomonas sp.]|nr:PEP-CTERM sorting domain-containing protein [Methylomonas sp.]